MKLATPLCALALSLVACGGAAPPPSDASTDKSKPQPAASLADERKQWMSGCDQEPGLTDYCACGFDVIVKSTTPEERNADAHPNLKKAIGALTEQCGDKLPASKLRDGFVKACAKEPALAGYCTCSFEILYKKGLVTKGVAAVKAVEPELRKACSSELFQATRASFMKACEEKQSQKLCGCTIDAMEKSQGREKLMSIFEQDVAEGKKLARAASIGCGAK